MTATLGTIAETVEREAIKAPALIVVGAVAARREALAWLERRPLHGRTVVVTRARAQASGLAATLRGLGADRGRAARDPDRVADRQRRGARARRAAIADYDLVCLTSPNGVKLLFEALAAAGLRRPRAGRRDGRRDRPRHRAGARRPRHRRRRRPRALRRRGAGRSARRGRGRGQAGARRPRRRGPRRPPRRAARARRRGRRRRPLRDRARGARRRTRSPRPRTPTTSPSPRPRP